MKFMEQSQKRKMDAVIKQNISKNQNNLIEDNNNMDVFK